MKATSFPFESKWPFPRQHQSKPGIESRMHPRPQSAAPTRRGSGPLERPGQPEELAQSFVVFAINADPSYTTGEVLTLLGGETTAV